MLRNLPPITAPADIITQAQETVAARLRARGQDTAAEHVERTGAGWAVRFEVARLLAERAVRVEHQPV